MIKLNLSFCITMLFISHAAFAAEDATNWREPGRWGVMIAQTSDGTQAAFVREADAYELNLQFDTTWSPAGADHTNKDGISGDFGLTLRAGGRSAIGDFNYFSYGVQFYHAIFAHDNGVNMNGDLSVGPYIGFQRHFAGTHFMLSGWILPYAYENIPSNNGSGGVAHTITNAYFHRGGIGFAYLF